MRPLKLGRLACNSAEKGTSSVNLGFGKFLEQLLLGETRYTCNSVARLPGKLNLVNSLY